MSCAGEDSLFDHLEKQKEQQEIEELQNNHIANSLNKNYSEVYEYMERYKRQQNKDEMERNMEVDKILDKIKADIRPIQEEDIPKQIAKKVKAKTTGQKSILKRLVKPKSRT